MTKIEQLNTDVGRFYRIPSGEIYPSVTSVLSSIPNPFIEQWRREVGDEVANKISKTASSTGTRFHSFCEDYLLDRKPKLDVFDQQAFKSAKVHLDHIKPVFLEKGLWSKTLKVAGTIDCFGSYKGKIFLIDFKTTKADKFPGEFNSYWMQTACYAKMVEEWSGRKIEDTMILMQNITSGSTEIHFNKIDPWLEEFTKIRNNFTKEYPYGS